MNATTSGRNWLMALWTAVDVGATLGSIGGAVAFILTQEALLVSLPVVLPLFALYASRQREGMKVQAALQDLQKSWQLTSQHLSQQEAAKLQQMDRAMQSWRDDFQKQLPVGKLKAIENKLTALEGTVLSAGRSAQSAARNVEGASNSLAEATATQMRDLEKRLAKDLQQDLQSKLVVPLEGLASFEARLQDISSRLQDLEDVQAKKLRALASDIRGDLEELNDSMQDALEVESRRTMDALQRLPAALAAALPVTDVQLLPGAPAFLQQQQPLLAQLSQADKSWLQDALQQAAERAIANQRQRPGEALPAVLADNQWEALGKRLRGIETGLQDVASSRGTDEGHEKEEALKREVVQLRAEVASVLAALQGTDPGANPLLPDLLGRMTDAVEDLRSKVSSLKPATAESAGGLETALEPIRAALADLQSSQSALQSALEQNRSTGEASVGPAAWQESVERAAQKAAQNALEEFSAQQVDAAELRSTVATTLDAVQQLEAATIDRINTLASTIGAVASNQGTASAKVNPNEDTGSVSSVPKGYKGRPFDTKEDAYRRMQELLSSKSKATPGTDGLAPTAAEETSGAQQAEGDMVPISLWLGQGSQRLTPQPVTADSAAADSSDGTSKPESFSGSPEESPTLPFPREYEGNAEAQKASNSAAATASAPAAQSSDRESEFTVGGSDSAESSGREAREASNAHDAQRAPYNDFGQQGRAGMEEARQDRQAHTNGSSPSTLNGTADYEEEERLQALVQEGVQLLREGRQLSNSGYDFGQADALLQDAIACFEDAAAIDSSSIKVQGNWGNALMAYGILKKRYLNALREAPPPLSYEDRVAAQMADEQLIDEAEAALVAAGRKFLAVVEQDQEDTRALGNWGRALCVRAELSRDPEAACALYEAAVDKFEAVLELDPSNRAVLRNCAFALYDLARLMPDPSSRPARQVLEDAARYLQDVCMINGSDEDAASALDDCLRDLENSRMLRRELG